MVSSPDRPGNQKLRSDPMALVNAKAFGPWAGSSELRSASSFRPGPAPVGGACVTPAKKLVGGVSRHDRGGGCRLFKVKVSETDPKITPDQASLSTISDPGGVIQPASQHFSAVNDSGRQAHLTDQQTEKTKILKPPLISWATPEQNRLFRVTPTQDGTIRRLAFGARNIKTRLIDCFADASVAQSWVPAGASQIT